MRSSSSPALPSVRRSALSYPGPAIQVYFDGLVGGGGTITGVNQFTYTAQFGGGWSGTLSAQDQVAYYQAGVNNISAGGAFGTSDYATVADVVAALQVDQALGSANFPGGCA